MEQDLAKSLVELIDQTIAEIEELKKSERFSASEVKLEGPGEGIAGKEPNGKLAAKAEDKAEAFEGKETPAEEAKEDEEKKKKEEEAKKAEMEKGVLDEAEKIKKEEEAKKAEDAKKAEEEAKKAEAPKEGYVFKKSEDEINSLMKSMIDDRVKPLEGKIDSILTLIKEIADAPVTQKSVSYKDVTPLKKNDDEVEPLNKAEVAAKLLELKKSGQPVDTTDITQAELGNPVTLQKIVAKYNIK